MSAIARAIAALALVALGAAGCCYLRPDPKPVPAIYCAETDCKFNDDRTAVQCECY